MEINQEWEHQTMMLVKYSKAKNTLAESITNLSIELSKELYDNLKEYMECMTFHYQSDGLVGLVDYYWSSFFVCLDKNYCHMKELKRKIDVMIREEYSKNIS